MSQALSAFDKTKKGVISFKDFQEISGNTFDPLTNDDALNHLFSVFDTKQEGYLYPEDLIQAAKALKIDLTPEEAGKIIDAMDLDRDGAVDVKEFKQVIRA